MVYVGLQLENTGHRAAPRAIGHPIHSLWFADSREFWENLSMPVICINLVQTLGKMSVTEKSTRSHPAKYSQNDGSTSINIVDALRMIVKRNSETMREAMIIYGRFLLLPARLPQSMTGRSGSTQGAKTVRIHEKKDMRIMVSMMRYGMLEYRFEIFLRITWPVSPKLVSIFLLKYDDYWGSNRYWVRLDVSLPYDFASS